ncbi:hypothetical protein L0156_29915 [bacterium]|nr:hypothetical protein [bacterium]
MEQDLQTFRLGPVLRHLAGLLCLFAAWKFLSFSDDSSRLTDHLTSVGFLIIAIILLFFPLLFRALSKINLKSACLLGVILALMLPWGEWFSLSTQTVRQHWGKILLYQVLFIYAAYLLITHLPALRDILNKFLQKSTGFLAANKYFSYLLPLLFFLFCAYVSVFFYHETPLITDAAAYLFQAKIFTRFHVDAPAPPQALTEFFTFSGDQVIIRNGRWFGMNFPGFSLLLAAGLAIGAEWLLNPFLGAVTCAIWIAYARRWHGEQQAALLGILMILSPFLIVIHSNPVVNAAELTIVSAFLYISRRAAEGSGGRLIWFLFPLIALGVLVRFFSVMALLLPVIVYTCFCEWKRKSIRYTAATVAGLATGLSLLLLYQWKLTGDPFVAPYVLEYSSDGLGIGAAGDGNVHTPARALENLSDSILALDLWVSGLFSGSIIFLAIFSVKTSKNEMWDRILLLSAAGLSTFYLFYFFQQLHFGPRYYAFLGPVLLLFTVRAVFPDSGESRSSVAAFLVLFLLISVPVRLPSLINNLNPATNITGNLKEGLRERRGEKILLFIDKKMRQEFTAWNEPFLDGPVIVCRDLGKKNRQIEAAFPEFRPLYYKKNENFRNTPLFLMDTQPSNRTEGAFSFFRMVKSIIAARDYPDRDCVDIVYHELLYGESAVLQLQFLERQLSSRSGDTRFDPAFRQGLLHIGRVFLLPRVAEEVHGEGWLEKLDTETIKQEMQLALRSFMATKEIGKPIVEQIQKMERRMNVNRDSEISDDEVRRYFSAKVRVFTSW